MNRKLKCWIYCEGIHAICWRLNVTVSTCLHVLVTQNFLITNCVSTFVAYQMEVQQISRSERVSVHCILCYTFFIVDHYSIKLAEINCPVCQCHSGVAFVEAILILTTAEGRVKKVCGAPEIFSPDENFVFFIILCSNRM